MNNHLVFTVALGGGVAIFVSWDTKDKNRLYIEGRKSNNKQLLKGYC